MTREFSSVSVLCVGEEYGTADPVGETLERVDGRLSVSVVPTARRGLDLLQEADIDCVVSDAELPDMDSLLFLEAIRSFRPDLPFILFTDRGSEQLASDAIAAGVTDYIPNHSGTEQLRVLARRIHAALDDRSTRGATASAATPASMPAQEPQDETASILESLPEPVLVGVDGICVYANQAATAMLSPGEVPSEPASPGAPSTLVGDPIDDFFTGVGDGDANGVSGAGWVANTDRPGAVDPFTEAAWSAKSTEAAESVDAADSAEATDSMEAADSAWTVDSEPATEPETFVGAELPDGSESAGTRVSTGDRAVLGEPDRPIARIRDSDRLVEVVTRVLTWDGDPGTVYLLHDVTDRSERQRELQSAFDRVSDAVLTLDTNWQVTFLNEQAERLLRRDRERLQGTSITDQFPPAADPTIREHVQRAIETNEPVTFKATYQPLDSAFEIRVFPSETGLTVYFRDITDEQRIESELRESVTALRRFHEITSDPDQDFETKRDELLRIGTAYLDLPSAFVTNISGGTQTVVATCGTAAFVQPGETFPIEESFCKETIASSDGTFAVRHVSEEGWADAAAHQRFGLESFLGGEVVVDGERYGTVCFAASDPREQEFSEMDLAFVELLSRWLAYELEQQEYRSQLEATNDQLEEFASIVSHDLRNPLNVAMGRLELAMEECDSDQLPPIEQAHTRMQSLIEEILTLAREGEVVDDMAAVDLASLSEACWENVETRDATVDIATDRTILADESRLAQLLENLVRNAVEHGGPAVTVTIGDLPDGFYVEDTGIGVLDQDRSKFFEAGYSTKDDGTGIGLQIVEQIATAHGWHIELTTGLAGGARFEFTGVEES